MLWILAFLGYIPSSMPYVNPYADGGEWLRANFHGHCSEHSVCATVPLETGVRQYTGIGAGCVTLTDHNHVTDLGEMRRAFPGTIFLEGFEYSYGPNFVIAGEHVEPMYDMDPREALIRSANLLRFICHPQPHMEREYWPTAAMIALQDRVDGIEAYNGHYGIARMREGGHIPDYRHVWDLLLTAGCQFWGYANDDFHETADFNNAFNMVCVTDKTPSGVVEAAKHGCCYGSTGLLLERVEMLQNSVRITLPEEAKGRFRGNGGRILRTQTGRLFDLKFDEKQKYVRFEAEVDGRLLFLQPFFKTT